MRKKVDVVFLTISSPILIGVYEDLKLIETISTFEKSSDILAKLYKEIDEKYQIDRLIYANGPGSFMAIKITYIFLKSIAILKNISLFALDAFYFNQNQPIKAIGKLYFVKIGTEIITQKLQEVPNNLFELPRMLENRELNTNTAPIYAISAVG